MRCSNCSRRVKPVVALDIDGTLGDYHGHFLRFAEQYLGRTSSFTAPEYLGTLPFRDWFSAVYDSDEAMFRQIKLAYRQGGMKRSMPVYEGMQHIPWIAKSRGAEVWITTTRPYLRLDGIDPDTREWLRRHKIEYDGLLYDEEKYRRLHENVDADRVVAVVDDLPEQYDSASDYFGADIPILRRNAYNQGVERPNMVENPNDLQAELCDRIARWNQKF